MDMFDCNNLTLELGNKTIVKDFNFSFTGPGVIMLEGENGVGKSSLLKTFAGFIIPARGNIKFAGQSIDLAGAGELSFLTTTSLGLMNELSGLEHIQLIAKSLAVTDEVLYQKINEFSKIEIFKEILDKKVDDYSQGMRQLLRLFLHLFFSPKYIFLDEPFLYLSPTIKDFIKLQIEELSNKSLIFITDQKFDWQPKNEYRVIKL
jgi:ABC-type multidrug transport system ATPase subunit